jgi:RNase adaptor protein for sRNA GlmZ degradation
MQLDTSDLDIRHLRKLLQHYFDGNRKGEQTLKIQLLSSPYKEASPKIADMIIDVTIAAKLL